MAKVLFVPVDGILGHGFDPQAQARIEAEAHPRAQGQVHIRMVGHIASSHAKQAVRADKSRFFKNHAVVQFKGEGIVQVDQGLFGSGTLGMGIQHPVRERKLRPEIKSPGQVATKRKL